MLVFGWGMICNPRYSSLAPSPQTPAARALISLWKELEEVEEGHGHQSVITLLDRISLRRSVKHILKHLMKAPKWRCSSYWFLMKLLSLWNRAHKACPTEFEKTPSLYIVPARVSIYSHCTQWGGLLLFSCQVMYDCLWPCGLQHARLPCPSPFPRFCSSSCPVNQWCHSTVSSSVAFLLFWEGTGKQKNFFQSLGFIDFAFLWVGQ